MQRIEDFRQRVEEVAREIGQDRELQRDIGRRRAELADVIKRFRSKGYGSWESTFSDDKLTTVLLGELVKGAITGADYWARAERSHKRRKPRGRKVAFPNGTGLAEIHGWIRPIAAQVRPERRFRRRRFQTWRQLWRRRLQDWRPVLKRASACVPWQPTNTALLLLSSRNKET